MTGVKAKQGYDVVAGSRMLAELRLRVERADLARRRVVPLQPGDLVAGAPPYWSPR